MHHRTTSSFVLALALGLGVVCSASPGWAQEPPPDSSTEALKRAREQFGPINFNPVR